MDGFVKEGFMNKVYEKHETLFGILLIIIYIVINSFCINIFGQTSLAGFIVNTLFSICLIAIMVLLKRTSYYGLVRVENPKRYLFFLPLIIIVSVNLWNGFNINNSRSEIIFHVLTMVNIGFIEEIIFRGFLFKMMAKNNVKSAIIVSSITFGVGHVINLFNGAELIPTLMQIACATSIGYLFVIIFHKSKSLVPCIVTHALVNSLSIFNIENTISMYISPIFLITIPLTYAIYINRRVKE
jgi:membrane protease YdiL (CAAX protease family)